MNKYIPVIGLEMHVELSTNCKMFCRCSADHFSKEPNTNVCPTCLGLPGALPYANNEAIESTVKFGLALGSEIELFSKFDRKHYFYPDLPKGYQVSQYDLPFCKSGKFEINTNSGVKQINITRIHLEEDTGKSIHKVINEKKSSLIDFNRSGVPLMEMVTEPDFDNSDDVVIFLKEILRIVRYLGISDADMDKGSMRLEANISLREVREQRTENKRNFELPDYKIELKNINSFRFLKRAIDIEVERQAEILTKGETISQETRGYDEIKDTTFTQRSKEEAKDYRYFPEPDIPPIRLSVELIEKLKEEIPELPANKAKRFKNDFGLPDNYIEFLVESRELAEYFESACALDKDNKIGVKTIASAIVNQKLHDKYPEPAGLVKKLLELTKTDYATNDETQSAIENVVNSSPDQVKKYKEGKVQIIGFMIGQVQKELKGKGDPKIINDLLQKKLNN